jgi:hypothetical protein
VALARAPCEVSAKSQAFRLWNCFHNRKNWLFCWTELGAEHLGIIQSLITTCKLHDLNPYTYLVDVLQRISQHPASQVADLTPRLWKLRFADKPLRSLVDPRHPDRQASRSL